MKFAKCAPHEDAEPHIRNYRMARIADAPHNLYAPVADDGGVSGDFLHGLKRRSPYQRLDAHVIASSLAAAGVLALGAALRHRRHQTGAALLTAGAFAFGSKALLAAAFER